MDIRRVSTADDHAALARVWQVVYRRDEPMDAATALNESEYGVTAWNGFEVLGGYSVVAHNAVLRGGAVRCGGIGGVGTMPEHRAGGVGKALMRWSLGEMRESGFGLACLYPYRETYYRQFGYETCGRRWQIKCPVPRLPRTEAELSARKISAADVLCLRPAYDGYIARLNGANRRTDADWTHRLGQKPPMIWALGDPVEAYVWTHFDGAFWDDLTLGEVVWSTRRGYLSLLAFLRGLTINRTAVIWEEPSNSPFMAAHMDQGVEVKLHRAAMFRVLNVPMAMAAIQPPETVGEFTMDLVDEDMPENHRVWQVAYGPDGVGAQPAPRSHADFRLNIRAFTPALMGEPSLADLLHAGLVEVRNSAGLEAAIRLLPAMPCAMTEFF